VLRLTRTRRKKNDGFIKPAFSSVQSRMKQQWQRPSLLFSSGSCEQPAAEEKRLPQRLSLIVAAAGAVLCSNGRCSSAGWGGSEPVDEHHFSPTRVSLLPLHTIVFISWRAPQLHRPAQELRLECDHSSPNPVSDSKEFARLQMHLLQCSEASLRIREATARSQEGRLAHMQGVCSQCGVAKSRTQKSCCDAQASTARASRSSLQLQAPSAQASHRARGGFRFDFMPAPCDKRHFALHDGGH